MFRLFDAINLAIIVALTASSSAFAQQNCCTGNPTTSVPEPASLALLAVGVGGVLFAKRRSRLSRTISALAIVAGAAVWAQSGVAQCIVCPLP
jgi:PEP-CTERM motif